MDMTESIIRYPLAFSLASRKSNLMRQACHCQFSDIAGYKHPDRERIVLADFDNILPSSAISAKTHQTPQATLS
jgi:hypothetical protein